MAQIIEKRSIDENALRELAKQLKIHRFFVVCGRSFYKKTIAKAFENCGVPYETFVDFSSNPVYEDVCGGVEAFKASGCDGIVAVGGGSALDVAKCISIFCEAQDKADYLEQPYPERKVPLAAIPTTAGTGSESTSFSVLYRDQKKYSVKHDSMLPDFVWLDSSLLEGLPDYQKKSTLLDALCQAIESWWSVKSNTDSIALSKRAIDLIVCNMDQYLAGNRDVDARILEAANLSGQAINITQTTAPHAMSYKLTGLFGFAHGHSVALCLPDIWLYMEDNLAGCTDSRGEEYLRGKFLDIANSLGYSSVKEAAQALKKRVRELGLNPPERYTGEELSELVENVNVERLQNNPVYLSRDAIGKIYERILSDGR